MHKSFKKLVSLVVAATMLISANSVAFALDAGTALALNLTSPSLSFDPAVAPATISYQATGDSTINELMVRVYKLTQVNNVLKCDTAAGYISLLQGPVTETAKGTTYNVNWDGKDKTGVVTTVGNFVPSGTYCYRIQWSNPPNGAYGYVEALIKVSLTSVNLGGTPGTGGTGGTTGGMIDGTGTITQSNPCSSTTTGLSVSVNPTIIDPKQGDVSYLCYYATQDLGYTSLYIYNNFGTAVFTDLIGTLKKGDWNQIPWNGKASNGTNLSVGTYQYKFFISNQVVSTGSISIIDRSVITNGGGTPAPTGPDITFFVNPSTILIDSSTKQTLQSATLTYYINHQVTTGLSIYIKDASSGNIIRTLLTKAGTLAVSNNNVPVTWDGTYQNGTAVPAGLYRFIISSAGQELDYWDVSVQYVVSAPPPGPGAGTFITSQSIVPTSFTPVTGSTTINFTTGKTVSNFQITVRDPNGQPFAGLFQRASLVPGTYSVQWGGFSTPPGGLNPAVATAGTYTYTFEATGESPVFGGNILVLSSPSTQFIVSQSVNPQTFNPFSPNLERTTFNFTTGKTVSNFRITIKNQAGSVVATLFANPTLTAGTYNVIWDGTSQQYVNGIPQYVTVPQGGYTYSLEADNQTPVVGSVYVSSTNGGGQNAPVIADLGPDKYQFNPTTGETVTLRFQVNQDARVDVYILSNTNSTTVRRLLTSNGISNNVTANVTNSLIWRGKENDDTGVNSLPTGNYTYYIEAKNSNGSAVTKTGTIAISTSGGGTQLMDVSNLTANSFYPESASGVLRFYINRDANVTIRLYRPDGSFLKTLVSNQFYSSGSNSAYWDGVDESGSYTDPYYNNNYYGNSTYYVPAGTYRFTVEASNPQYGFDSESANVVVLRNSGGGTQMMDVTNVYANSFYPQNGSGTLHFTTNHDADITISIYRPNGTLLKTLLSNRFFTSGSNVTYWDGRDTGLSSYVPTGTYRFTVEANSVSYGYDSESSNVIVTNSGTYGGGDCGSFTDVSKSNYLCAAIEFVKSRGIFAGYPDGTLRPNAVIQRAELLAVMQKAFGFALDSYDPYRDGNLGFSDLSTQTNEWYMPYIKTFKRLNLIAGYPDGTFRPGRTMNTAELYLVLLKAAQKAGVANFTIDPDGGIYRPPFIDTPIDSKTRWYIKYAEFAQLNDLVTTDRFYPERGISRGQVIKLIYDTYQKNLIRYSGTPYYNNIPTNYNNTSNNTTSNTGTMQITNVTAPAFNPTSRTGTISFYLNHNGNVTINIYRPDGTFLKTLNNNQYYSSGSNIAYWDGTDNGNLNYAPTGSYKITISATASQYGTDTETVYINLTNSSSTSNLLQLTNITASSFNVGNTGTINFNNNYDANITITLYKPDGTYLKALQTNQYYLAGQHAVIWDGRDYSGTSNVPAGQYKFTISGQSSQYGSDTETGYISVY